jgi:hypothetical protein
MQLNQTIIRFPEIKLATRDAHKLRGYFGNLFKEHSALLHNHFDDGSLRYKYPLVQYKVVDNVPVLLGINEGGELLIYLFLKISELNIDCSIFPVYHKNIENKTYKVEIIEDLFCYEFKTLWMGLNQKNYKTYIKADETEKKLLLKKTLTANILSFFKGIDYHAEEKIILTALLNEKQTKFKISSEEKCHTRFNSEVILKQYQQILKSISTLK